MTSNADKEKRVVSFQLDRIARASHAPMSIFQLCIALILLLIGLPRRHSLSMAWSLLKPIFFFFFFNHNNTVKKNPPILLNRAKDLYPYFIYIFPHTAHRDRGFPTSFNPIIPSHKIFILSTVVLALLSSKGGLSLFHWILASASPGNLLRLWR